MLKILEEHNIATFASATSKHNIIDGAQTFYGISLMELIETYGTPLKVTYLPAIDEKIKVMTDLFATAIKKVKYSGRYYYHYCTKSSHFQHITEQVLRNKTGLEISSAFDIPIVWNLYQKGLINLNTSIICNGFKPQSYQDGIIDLMDKGFSQILPILDSKDEVIAYINSSGDRSVEIGIRVCLSNFAEEDQINSRFGISAHEIIPFYIEKLQNRPNIKVSTLHFFFEKGIGSNEDYWNQLRANAVLYCELKRINPDLQKIDIGGGMPFQENFAHHFDYASAVERIVSEIHSVCQQYDMEDPDIISEFGKYTVAESSATVFQVIHKKVQTGNKKWLFIDGSFVSHLPDTWAINQHFPVLPVNNLDVELENVWLSGLSCDKRDYYLSDASDHSVLMPNTKKTQFLCFFNTGAYQEVLGGFGGVSHCLTPSAKHILISKDERKKISVRIFSEEFNSRQALRILGY